MNSFCCYWLFGLPMDCTFEELNMSFKRSMQEVLVANLSTAEEKIDVNILLDAYNILSNEFMRKKYDFYIQLKALHLYEQLNEVNKLMKEAVKLYESRDYDSISVGLQLDIKKTIRYVNNILTHQQDVANYFEMFYLPSLSEYNVLKEKYVKRF